MPAAELPRTHIVAQDIFMGVLLRERRRADRSNGQLLLLAVSCPDPSAWDGTIESLKASTRETDVVGWLEPDRVLGLIVPSSQGSAASLAATLLLRIHTELSGRLSPAQVDTLSIDICAHPEQTEAGHLSALPALHYGSYRRRSYSAVKRALDVAGSLVLLGLLSPLFLVVAALVKLTSPGPVFFRQSRIGYRGEPFRMLKFRTMRVDADHKLHQQYVTAFIKSTEAAKQSANNGLFKIAADPRVTSIGRLLRKTSIDELPQLWNVVRGDMSLVGPRPPLQYEVDQYESWHRRRVIEAKPGITGLWQVKGRSRTTFDDMVRLDLRYVKTRSLITDVKILLATPAAVITGKGAC